MDDETSDQQLTEEGIYPLNDEEEDYDDKDRDYVISFIRNHKLKI